MPSYLCVINTRQPGRINIASKTTYNSTTVQQYNNLNINTINITTFDSNNNMSSPSALAVPAKAHNANEIASSQASYTSADADKTDVEQGDITDLEKRPESAEKVDREGEGDVDIEATAETKETAAAAAEAENDDDDYPKGAKLGFIVLALALTIFLMSLDFVSTPFPVCTHLFDLFMG